jgi:hypothetical protein
MQIMLSKLPILSKPKSESTPLELEMVAIKAWSSKSLKMEEGAATWLPIKVKT